MPANQKNSNFFTYTDDNGLTWNKRGPVDVAINAIDGSTPFTPGVRVWAKNTRRDHTRHAIFQDPATFRTVTFPVFTTAAFAAITGATVLAVNVPGEVAAVNYSLIQKVSERQPVARTSRQLADHA